MLRGMTLVDIEPTILDERSLDLDESAGSTKSNTTASGYQLLAEFGDGKTPPAYPQRCRRDKLVRLGHAVAGGRGGGSYTTDGEVCILDEYLPQRIERLQDRARKRRCCHIR